MSEATTVERPSGHELAPTRAEVCVVACADAFRDAGEILASAFGTVPAIGVRLARHTFSPDLILTDGEAYLVRGSWPIDGAPTGEVEGWVPFRTIFDLVWHGKRHVIMIPSQLDQFGNMNISAIGDYRRPTVQLIGMRGAPGNTVCHPTSYWVPRHSTRVFVSRVDTVSGVGNDRARAAGPGASRYHHLRRVITDLAVFDFDEATGAARLLSRHPGVPVDEIVANTGFPLILPEDVPESRLPTTEELRLIREVLDPRGRREREVPR